MGVGMYYEEVGSGVPVLAVHGWAPDHRLMSGCLEPIFATRAGYRRLYPDLPAMGRSPVGTVASSDDLLGALLAFIDEHIGAEPFVLVGESYGGYLARAIVRRRPEQVRGMALICPVGEPRHELRTLPQHAVLRRDPGALDGLPADQLDSFTGLAVVHTREVVERFFAEVQPGLGAADFDAMAAIQQRWLLAEDPDADCWPPYLGPSLFLLGRQDVAVGFHDQLRLLPQYPRASVAVLDVAGHNLQIEQPALFAAMMNEWLDRVAE